LNKYEAGKNMNRSITLNEDGKQIFRFDVNIKHGQDNLEYDIAAFAVQLEQKKNMISCKKVISNINRLRHFGLDTMFDFFSEPSNVDRFAKELHNSTENISVDLKARFSRQNIRKNLLEALS
jgi:hypothetical protein